MKREPMQRGKGLATSKLLGGAARRRQGRREACLLRACRRQAGVDLLGLGLLGSNLPLQLRQVGFAARARACSGPGQGRASIVGIECPLKAPT